MKIGILTGGGDCPGLNAAIRAVVRKGVSVYGDQVIGILEGWRGLLRKGMTEELNIDRLSGILHMGGTILKSSRTNPFKEKNGPQKIQENVDRLGLEGLVIVGGEDTLGVAYRLFQDYQVKVVGVPKTIDNDLPGTDYTFGFDTAVNIATEAIDRLHTTAESHNRVIVVEVMGRHAGWIAVEAGLAGGADMVLIPEHPFNIGEVCDAIRKRHKRGRDFSIVVVAEGAKMPEGTEGEGYIAQEREVDAFGHIRLGGIGHVLAREIKKRTGFQTRVTILGYLQRGGTPTAFDRILATRFGIAAIDLIHQGGFGQMVSLRGNRVVPVDLEVVTKRIKTVDEDLYHIAEVFFG